jgi:L-lactate dehydrogenase complex protein LldG
MVTREEMLDRIRRALGRPQTGRLGAVTDAGSLPPARLEGVMSPIERADYLPKFEAELEKLAGATYRAANAAQLDETLRSIIGNSSAVVLSRNPLLKHLRLAEKLRAWGVAVEEWPEKAEADDAAGGNAAFKEASFQARVGITGVDFVLAETGSLVLTSRTEGSQLASLAPPVHVALYRESQVAASLDDILEALNLSGGPLAPDGGRSVVFVTGTSRTADIEQVLIRGVHGPRVVHAILVGEACLA